MDGTKMPPFRKQQTKVKRPACLRELQSAHARVQVLHDELHADAGEHVSMSGSLFKKRQPLET